MKNSIFRVLIIFVFTALLQGCIHLDGKWDDNIKLSVKNVEFDGQGDSLTISTKGTWWWVTDITVNMVHFYGFKIDPDSEHYSIKDDCFTVERRDAHTLFIRVEANRTDTLRTITVGLEAGDYFDRVTITQKATFPTRRI